MLMAPLKPHNAEGALAMLVESEMTSQEFGRGPPVFKSAALESTKEGRTDAFDDADLAVMILQALTVMAARSKRHQADLTAALAGAEIDADTSRVRNALRLLRAQGAIENLVPLSDGGLLLSVTQRSAHRHGPTTDWLALDQLDSAAD
jgi:hypothetical protein